MLDLKFVRDNPDLVREALKKRNNDLDVDVFLKNDEQRRKLLMEVETLKAERNKTSGEIAKRKRAKEDASELIENMSRVSARVKELDSELAVVNERQQEWLLSVPNIPNSAVPVGDSEDDNPEVRKWGEKPEFSFEPREHWELGVELGGLDFERAAKLTGARFTVTYGWAARLERALSSLMLDMHTLEHGYIEATPPFIVNSASLTGTGQLPKFKDDLFKISDWDFWLIPTAEVPVTNFFRNETLKDENYLPSKFCSLTPCFRSEAGSYGKDTKGLIRQHQFYKVEMVKFAHPDTSYDELEKLTANAEAVLQRLNLHYRVIELCTGDLGFSSAKTYDIEVWLPGQGKYREISSCSNFEDFQARRANIRFKPKGEKKSRFVHTLNGSGLAVGRTLVAVLENYQQEDGSLVIPEALRPYMGGIEVVEPSTSHDDIWI